MSKSTIQYKTQVEELFTEEQRAAIRELASIEVHNTFQELFRASYPQARNEVQAEALKIIKETLSLGAFITSPVEVIEIT